MSGCEELTGLENHFEKLAYVLEKNTVSCSLFARQFYMYRER